MARQKKAKKGAEVTVYMLGVHDGVIRGKHPTIKNWWIVEVFGYTPGYTSNFHRSAFTVKGDE